MARRQPVRDVLGALVVAVATASGLSTLTPLPWLLALVAGLGLGALALLLDVIFFDRPVPRRSRVGIGTISCLSAATLVSALLGAFLIGHSLRNSPTKYPFVVTNESGVVTPIKAVPYEKSATGQVVETGETVWVDCFVDQRDGRWYRLSDEQGWLRGRELLAAPHTGLGTPPRCPD